MGTPKERDLPQPAAGAISQATNRAELGGTPGVEPGATQTTSGGLSHPHRKIAIDPPNQVRDQDPESAARNVEVSQLVPLPTTAATPMPPTSYGEDRQLVLGGVVGREHLRVGVADLVERWSELRPSGEVPWIAAASTLSSNVTLGACCSGRCRGGPRRRWRSRAGPCRAGTSNARAGRGNPVDMAVRGAVDEQLHGRGTTARGHAKLTVHGLAGVRDRYPQVDLRTVHR